MIREIVHIDEDKCDGCGLCVPSCAEGAIRIVDGKARLVSDALCDGLGACLGHCPQGAITIERRAADAFDEDAVATARQTAAPPPPSVGGCPTSAAGASHAGNGCPGARLRQFTPAPDAPAPGAGAGDSANAPTPASALTHWPVQLNLLPPDAPVLRHARLLIAADCVPVACGEFHTRLLAGRAVAIGCPKFDDVVGYAERLAAIIRASDLRELAVARMEVPCCSGLVIAVREARRQAGSTLPIREVVVDVQGRISAERELPAQDVA
jgi:NAD-dependent dihydropyrimidine dehydrogenase PreA subunit